MALEIERKYIDADLGKARSRLFKMQAKTQGPHFEKNIIFSNIDLKKDGKILRLRKIERGKESSCLFTYKKKMESDKKENLKIREELETFIDDFQTMYNILLNLGYEVVAVEEKVRESWQVKLRACDKYKEEITMKVDLDCLPFGTFVEIEGNPDAMDELAGELGLDKCGISTNSYFEIYRTWLNSRGLPVSCDFRFRDEDLERIRKQFGLIMPG